MVTITKKAVPTLLCKYVFVSIYVPAAKGMIGLMLCMICAMARCNITVYGISFPWTYVDRGISPEDLSPELKDPYL